MSPGATAREQSPWWWPRSPRRTAFGGFAAFLSGYVVTAVAFVVELQSMGSTTSGSSGFVSAVIDQAVGVGGRQVVASSGGELALALRAVGWAFFSAQQIPLDGTASGLGVSAMGRVDVLTLAGEAVEIPLTPAVYYAIPPVCLAGAGWWLARTRGAATLRAGAVAGGGVVLGYLPTVVFATLLLEFSATVNVVVASASITAQPVFLRALTFGAGYALVFGALGGILAAKTERT
jgi:hypothetical protein